MAGIGYPVGGDLEKYTEIVEALRTMPEEMEKRDGNFTEAEYDAWWTAFREWAEDHQGQRGYGSSASSSGAA